jgi:beta-lactamase regulating signal transducer with metallopeptidase domain
MLWWFAQNALAAGLLAGLVALVCRFVRLGPAAQHALWLVVLIKLVTPPLIVWPWALPGVGEQPAHADVATRMSGIADDESFAIPLPFEARESAGASSLRQETLPPPLHLIELDPDAPASNQSERAASTFSEWLVLLVRCAWLAGTVFLCVLQIVRIARFRQRLRHTKPAPCWLEELVAKVAVTLGVRRPRTLLISEVGSPAVWSLGRPKLLWPACLLEGLPRSYQRSVIAHELAHLRRRDHWISWLQLAAECVWWWYPLFWYVRRQLRFQAELACDAWVVTSLPEDRRTYAEALIEITQVVSQKAAPLPVLGIHSAARQEFERRLTMIMRDRVPCQVPVVGLVAIGVLALVSLPGWSQSGAQEQPVRDVEKRPAPEKAITVVVPVELDYQQPRRVIKLAQEIVGDKPVEVEVKPGSGSERDRRIERLEEQLQELLKEVQALRAGGKPRTIIQRAPTTKPAESAKPVERARVIIDQGSDVKRFPAVIGQPGTKSGTTHGYFPKDRPEFGVIHRDAESGLTLSRAVYRLPRAKAEALAKLLSEHSKVEVLETRVEGDSLIVATTPEAQQAIQQFISLLGTTLKNVKLHAVTISPDGKTFVTGTPELKVDTILEFRQDKLDAPGKDSVGEKKDN